MGRLKAGTSIADFEIYHQGNLIAATKTTNGLLSSIDKTKLDELNKIENSLINGNIKINGTETTIYTHPINHDDRYFTEIELTATTGATKIGATINGITGANVQTVLENMKTYIDGKTLTAGTGISISGSTISLKNTGVVAGTYRSVVVDAQGRITAGTNPTTLSGYGITDAALSSHTHSYLPLSGGTITGRIYLKGDTMTSSIHSNNSPGRQELAIYASGDAYSTGSAGAGIHLYGNNDIEHSGNIAFLTGDNGSGTARMIISQRGNITIGPEIWDYVDTKQDKALITIKNPINQPAILFEGTNTYEGELAVPAGEHFSIGQYNGTTFTEAFSISDVMDTIVNNKLEVRGSLLLGGATVSKILKGTLTITPVENTPTYVTLTFPSSFPSKPTVVVTPVSSVPGSTVLGVGVTAETTTSCRIYVTRTNTTDTIINWIAIA